MLYHSTNNPKKKYTFKQALFMGLAEDGGLFVPSSLPKFSKEEINKLRKKKYSDVAYSVLKKFLHKDIPLKKLKEITQKIYNFDIPIEKINEKTFLARLDQGPTASFKDFAAGMIAELMHYLKSQKKIKVLVATSGDTGSAIGNAYHNKKGIDVYILYPKKEVSSIQEKHLNSFKGNVKTIAVDGKFDDCQKMVKEAFLDKEIKNLTSANSINIGRLLPQIVYYFYIYFQTSVVKEKISFCIPSGNFGSALGCEIARRMGLPIDKILIAVNENDCFPKFIKNGIFKKISPSVACISNAMNVGNPSNLARFFEFYSGKIDKEGITYKLPNLEKLRKNIFSVSVNDKQTKKTIEKYYKKKIVLEPHGAVGLSTIEKIRKKKEMSQAKIISLETAHPSKFPEVLKELKIDFEIHPQLKNLKTTIPIKIKNSYQDLKKLLK